LSPAWLRYRIWQTHQIQPDSHPSIRQTRKTDSAAATLHLRAPKRSVSAPSRLPAFFSYPMASPSSSTRLEQASRLCQPGERSFACPPHCAFSVLSHAAAPASSYVVTGEVRASADSRSWTGALGAPLLTACRLTSRRVVRPGQRQGERHKHGQQACGNQHILSAAVSLHNPTDV